MNQTFEGQNLIELLDLLEDVPQPPAVSMTPQTPGWTVVFLGLALVLVMLCIWLWRRWRANAYRRAALAELQRSDDDAAAIADILRRTALAAFPRDKIVPLTGEAWLDFLDSTYPGSAFANGAGRAVSTAPYERARAVPGLRDVAADWVRLHTGSTRA